MSRPLRAVSAALLALVVSGCQSVFFGVVNRSSADPDASVVYDPEHALSLDVYRPRPGVLEPAPAPVVVFLYGGAWQAGSREQYRFVGSRLADQGVLTIVADYRTWPQAGFPDFVNDAARAVGWAHANAARLGGNRDRLFVAGHSAGAQIAALLGTDPRYLLRLGLAPADLAGVIGLAGPYEFTIGGKLVPIFGPRSQWADAMPLRFVNGDEPPFLLVHGDHDRTVEVANSRRLHAALSAAGVDSELLVLPGAGHFAPAAAFYAPDREPAVLPAVLRFIKAEPAQAGNRIAQAFAHRR